MGYWLAMGGKVKLGLAAKGVNETKGSRVQFENWVRETFHICIILYAVSLEALCSTRSN